MKKILMLVHGYGTQGTIGAIRPTKLVKYLAKSGKYKITVVCAKVLPHEYDETRKGDEVFEDGCLRVHQECMALTAKMMLKKTVEFYRKTRIQSKKMENYLDEVEFVDTKVTVADILNAHIENAYQKHMTKVLDSMEEEYDVVLSSCYPIAVHFCAMEYKAKHPMCKWIADFRDPLNVPLDIKGIRNRHYTREQLERIFAEQSDAVTCVSESCIGAMRDKAHILFNGFDPDDIPKNVKPLWNDKKFHIVYTGRLYPRRRTESLFKALKELSDSGQIEMFRIQVDYAGPTGFRLIDQAEKYELGSIVSDMGIVTHKKAIEMQQSANLLLLLTWNTEKEKSVISGKAYECFFSSRPVLALVSGDAAGSVTKEQIEKSNCGFCFEEATPEDYSAMKQYVLALYKEFIETGKTACNTNWEYVQQYSYENIANQLSNIIDECDKTAKVDE